MPFYAVVAGIINISFYSHLESAFGKKGKTGQRKKR